MTSLPPIPGPDSEQIARMVVDGASNREIADALGIPVGTVATRLWRLFSRTGVATRTDFAVWYAAREAVHGFEIAMTALDVGTLDPAKRAELEDIVGWLRSKWERADWRRMGRIAPGPEAA